MAKKSKTQRAKASAAKANKKDREEREALAQQKAPAEKTEAEEPKSKGGIFKKKEDKPEAKQQVAAAKKEDKPKKKSTRFQFFKDVRAELKRVTWPSREDVTRWTGVVVGALIFFGVYVALLDSAIANGLLAIAPFTMGV